LGSVIRICTAALDPFPRKAVVRECRFARLAPCPESFPRYPAMAGRPGLSTLLEVGQTNLESEHGPICTSIEGRAVSRETVRWALELGARCPVPGARCPVPGARCPVPGARCPVPGARCST
jgi:hypothetical protein